MQSLPIERWRLRKAERLHVLIVDDDLSTASAIRRLLQSSGYEAREANSYRAALAMAGQWMPDFLISDIAMPGKDGLELIRKLREAYPNLKAIAISGMDSHETADAAREAGYVEFLAKPLNVDRLLKTMDKALSDRIEQ